MSVGAKDRIDQMLVKRYAKENVNNPQDAATMAISSDRYWELMKDVAQVQMTLVKVSTFAQKGLNKCGLNPAKNQA